jgi:hypothetical protein
MPLSVLTRLGEKLSSPGEKRYREFWLQIFFHLRTYLGKIIFRIEK